MKGGLWLWQYTYPKKEIEHSLLRAQFWSRWIRILRVAWTLRGCLLVMILRPEPCIIVFHLLICVSGFAVSMILVCILQPINVNDTHPLEVFCSLLYGRVHTRRWNIELLAKIPCQLRRGPTPEGPRYRIAFGIIGVEEGYIAGHIELKALSGCRVSCFSTGICHIEKRNIYFSRRVPSSRLFWRFVRVVWQSPGRQAR